MTLLRRIEIPHVFVLLTAMIVLVSLASWVIPSGEYQRETQQVAGLTRDVVIPGTYREIPKHVSLEGALLGERVEGKASPVGVMGCLSAIPEGMVAAAEIIFFIFIIGGAFGILQRTGTVVAVLKALLGRFASSGRLLAIVLMTTIGIGGSTLGMSEEFIPLVPIFLLVAKDLGYDRIFGVALVLVAMYVGFASATTNPFTVQIAQGIAQLPLNSELPFRTVFLVVTLAVSITYVLWYGERVRKDPSRSIMAGDAFEIEQDVEHVDLEARHLWILGICVAIFALLLWAVQTQGWSLNQMAGGFLAMGGAAMVIGRLSLDASVKAMIQGMREMLVAALCVGFARGIQVVADASQVTDSLIHAAASVLQGSSSQVAAQGMLLFQTALNFFIPSGSGQAVVTMPLMAPLADVLGLTRQTAVFAFTCGDGFSNTIIPTSGVLMAILALAGVPYTKWLRFMLPLFAILMVLAGGFLALAVHIEL